MVRLTAPFSLRAEGAEIIRDDDFPVVELAAQLGAWLTTGAQDEFRYRSLESDDEDILRFVRRGGEFVVSSSWAPSEGVRSNAEDLQLAVSAFVLSIAEAARRNGVDLTEIATKIAATETKRATLNED
jgi:hypothetical protein